MIDGVSLVIPAYNEAGAVGGVVRAFRSALDATGLVYEILLVDDGSPTPRPPWRRKPVRRSCRRLKILATAWRSVAAYLPPRFEHIVICDADGTYPAAAIAELTRLAEHLDMVVAARTGPHFRGWGPRALARIGLRVIASFVVGRRVPDVNSGYRIFARPTACATSASSVRGSALRPGSLWP